MTVMVGAAASHLRAVNCVPARRPYLSRDLPGTHETLHPLGKQMSNIDETRASWLLPFVLGATAGAVDVIGFLALGGLFTAHITGNIVVLAAHNTPAATSSSATRPLNE